MAISNINSIYTSLLNNLKEKNAAATAAATDNTKSTEGTGTATSTKATTGTTTGSTKTDSLDLGTDGVDAEAFLNYGQLAKYNMPTLSDYMSGSENSGDSADLFGMNSNDETDSGMDLNSIMNESESSGSSEDDGMFDAIIQSTTTYNNQMINQAIKKYAATNSTDSDAFAKKVEALKAEIKADMEKTAGKTTTAVTSDNTATSSSTKTK